VNYKYKDYDELFPDTEQTLHYKYNQHTVKHNSINDFIKVHFLHCFVQRHNSALVMSHLQVDYFSS